MKKTVGILLVLLIAIAMGLLADDFREVGISMTEASHYE
jgi:hypothetical protein